MENKIKMKENKKKQSSLSAILTMPILSQDGISLHSIPGIGK